ncbi:MAG: peptidoglycan editing factor PgeF [Pseudomonadota bacterium]|nr:peptidoglycan editing factor PgeF [Pseudomonadota bacterium]
MSAQAFSMVITPDWPAPMRVRAASTERKGGASEGPYTSQNLGLHVGDDAEVVISNRRALMEALGLVTEPLWLEQLHGNIVLDLDTQEMNSDFSRNPPAADGVVTSQSDKPCVIMTADCLPVLFCDTAGTRIGIAHAGWRGLAAGVLSVAIKRMGIDPQALLVWLGPAISQNAYEVGDEVRQALIDFDRGAGTCFKLNDAGRWQADLYQLARRSLKADGVHAIYGGGFCTHTESERFFSHRREAPCGRMATLIWLDS